MTASLLVAEFRKLWTIPALRWLLVASIVIGFVLGLGGAFADELTSAVTAAWLTTMISTVLVTTLAAGSEYRHHTIVMSVLRTGFDPLVTAKVIVAAATGLATGLACGLTTTLGAFAAPGPVMEPAELFWTAITGTVGTVSWAVLGVGMALLVKRSDGLVALLIVWCAFLEPLLVSLMYLADAGFAFVAGPGMASLALAGSERMWSIDLLSPPAAAVAMLSWALLVAGGGWWMARQRELV